MRSIGFVEEGQSLAIRYDAFPYQKFGIYSGKVSQVSKTLLLPSELLNSPHQPFLVEYCWLETQPYTGFAAFIFIAIICRCLAFLYADDCG